MIISYIIIHLCTEMTQVAAVIASLALLSIGLSYLYPTKVVKFIERMTLMVSTKFKVKHIKLADDFEVVYMERGSIIKDKISILLVHGFGTSKFKWHSLDRYIPENMNVIAIDLPGHGGTTEMKSGEISLETSVTKIKEFCVAVGLDKKRFHILGTSMGGHLSAMYTMKYPEDIVSLTLVSPAGFKSPIESKMVDTYLKTKDIDILPLSVEQYKRSASAEFYHAPKIPDFIIRGYVQQYKEQKSYMEKVIAPYYIPEIRHSLSKSIHKVQAPTLVVWGKEDKIVSFTATESIKEKLPNCRIVLLDACGHAVSSEKPKELAEAMLNFINNIECES